MCLDRNVRAMTPNKAARELARLMERQLGYAKGHIDPIALRLFIRAYWTRVSACAHIIHNESVDEARPASPPAEVPPPTGQDFSPPPQ